MGYYGSSQVSTSSPSPYSGIWSSSTANHIGSATHLLFPDALSVSPPPDISITPTVQTSENPYHSNYFNTAMGGLGYMGISSVSSPLPHFHSFQAETNNPDAASFKTFGANSQVQTSPHIHFKAFGANSRAQVSPSVHIQDFGANSQAKTSLNGRVQAVGVTSQAQASPNAHNQSIEENSGTQASPNAHRHTVRVNSHAQASPNAHSQGVRVNSLAQASPNARIQATKVNSQTQTSPKAYIQSFGTNSQVQASHNAGLQTFRVEGRPNAHFHVQTFGAQAIPSAHGQVQTFGAPVSPNAQGRVQAFEAPASPNARGHVQAFGAPVSPNEHGHVQTFGAPVSPNAHGQVQTYGAPASLNAHGHVQAFGAPVSPNANGRDQVFGAPASSNAHSQACRAPASLNANGRVQAYGTPASPSTCAQTTAAKSEAQVIIGNYLQTPVRSTKAQTLTTTKAQLPMSPYSYMSMASPSGSVGSILSLHPQSYPLHPSPPVHQTFSLPAASPSSSTTFPKEFEGLLIPSIPTLTLDIQSPKTKKRKNSGFCKDLVVSCLQCGHKCSSTGHLKRHHESHGANRTFKCTFTNGTFICDCSYSRQDNLTNHMMRAHNVDNVKNRN